MRMKLKTKKLFAGVLALAMVFTSMGFGGTGQGLGFGTMEAMAAEWGSIQFPVEGEIKELSTITIGAYPNMPTDVSFTVKYDTETERNITGNTYMIPRGMAGKSMYIYAHYNNKQTMVAVLPNAVKVLADSSTDKQIVQVLTDKQLCAGETVSAKVVPADATVTYEWVVNGSTVSTEKTYTIPSDAGGNGIFVRATGTGEYAGLSNFSSDVAVVTPLTAVDITGEKKVGNEVVANLDPTGGTAKYNWKIDGEVQNTDGAVNFTIPEGSSGKMLSVQAVGTGDYGKAVESTSYTIEGGATVSISGVIEAGQTVTAIPSRESESGYSDWEVCWKIDDEVIEYWSTLASSFDIPSNAGGKSLQVGIMDGTGTYWSDLHTIKGEVFIPTVKVTGTPKVGETLTATFDGVDSTTTYTITWFVDGGIVFTTDEKGSSAASTNYTLTNYSAGKEVYCLYTNKTTGEEIKSNIITVSSEIPKAQIKGVKIIGDIKHGGYVFAELQPMNATATYKWESSDSYHPTLGETQSITIPYGLNGEVWVTATGTGDYEGVVESIPVVIGTPSITGVSLSENPEQGSTLSPTLTPVKATATYEYFNGQDTSIGSGDTYTIPSDYVGDIYVVATGAGNYEGTATSNPVTVVAKSTPPTPTPSVEITGTNEVGATLTATPTKLDGMTQFDATWYSGAEVVKTETQYGVFNSTYTVQETDKGKEIYCVYANDMMMLRYVSNTITIAAGTSTGGKLTDSAENVTDQNKDINDMATDWTGDVLVQVTQGQTFVVTIPAVVTLDGSLDNPETAFDVTVTANISGLDTITVAPTESRITFTEAAGVKNPLQGDFTVEQTEYSVARCGQASLEAGHVEHGLATIEKLSAGQWTATTGFRISVKSN